MPREKRTSTTRICDICEQRRKLNRFGVCRECAEASGSLAAPEDRMAMFTASHALKDLLPYADKDLDAPREWFRRNK